MERKAITIVVLLVFFLIGLYFLSNYVLLISDNIPHWFASHSSLFLPSSKNTSDSHTHLKRGKNKPMGASGASKFRTICVYCGSTTGNKPSYGKAAVELGEELVEKKIDLVYGGGSIGLMGLVSKAVHDGGRHVLGVIPRALMPREITGETIGEVRVVSDMHQRKAEMARRADAFIALPGGYGTMEELMEVVTWAQLGIHRKPVGLLNVDGFYNSLLSFVDKAVGDGFVSPISRGIIVSAATAKELVEKLEEYVPEYDEITSKLIWENVGRMSYGPQPGVFRT